MGLFGSVIAAQAKQAKVKKAARAVAPIIAKAATKSLPPAAFVAGSPARKASVSRQLAQVQRAYASAGLNPAEAKDASTVLFTGQKMGASKKELLAGAETGLVETHFSRPGEAQSDGSSAGWRQETAQPQYGSEARRMKPKPTAKDFFSETAAAGRGKGETAGQLAQSVQRSAYPGRYDEAKPQAKELLHAFHGSPAVAAAAPAPQQITKFKAVEKAANKLSSAHIPYVWGGGHGSFSSPKSGLDCSGAVSAVLHSIGVTKTPLTSGAMGSVLKPGPGAVTVYYNDGHTFMKIGDKYWGTSVGDSGSGGLGNHPAPSGAYLSQYKVGHVPGLGKEVAANLGIKLSGGGGSTATFSGGVHQDTPGFSSKPILSNARKTTQRKKALNRVAAYYPDASSPSSAAAASKKFSSTPVV